MVRAPSYDKNGVKKGLWSAEEDDKLIAFIQKDGTHLNWRQLPRLAGLSRCGKSCRLRWVNYLQPGVKRGSYTKEEEDLIIELHEEVGNKWSMIAAKLPGRTDNEIKNHWHSNLKKRAKQNPPSDQVKEQSSETFGRKTNKKRESEAENDDVLVTAAAPCDHQILESSPMTVEKYSGIKWSTEGLYSDFWTEPFVADNTYIQILESSPLTVEKSSGINWSIADDRLASWGTYEGLYSDFWTEPFVAAENEYPFSLEPCVFYCDDGIDWFDVPSDLQEIPQN